MDVITLCIIYRKMRYAILFFPILFGSCNNQKKESSKFDKDTTCLKAINKAKADVGKGKLVYYYHAGSLLYNPLRCEYELDSLLKPFNIELANYMTSDVVILGQWQGCYEDYMNENLAIHFGKNFIDSLKYIADSLYVSKNLNTLFDYYDCETEPTFPGDSVSKPPNFNAGLQAVFDKRIEYPKGYVRKTKANDMAFANFDLEIDRFGKAKIIESQFVFSDTTNHRFENKFRAVFEPIIINTKWKPATIKQQNVSSKHFTFLYFK